MSLAACPSSQFDNLEAITRLLAPENVALLKGLRERHEAELDFRNEAANLRE